MPLPDLNQDMELPEGVHQATLNEVITRFGSGTSQRETVTARLQRIYQLAKNTGNLQRLIIFGSYITAKPRQNDIDIVLIFDDKFDLKACDDETKKLLDRQPRYLVPVFFGAVHYSLKLWMSSSKVGKPSVMEPVVG